jgi:hypothetical protein
VESEIKRLEAESSDLDRQIARMEADIKGLISIVKGAQFKIQEAKARYDRAFLQSDEAGMAAARDEIAQANTSRDEALSTLSSRDFAGPLQTLRERDRVLNVASAAVLSAAQAEKERADKAFGEAVAAREGRPSHLFKFSEIENTLRQYGGQVTGPEETEASAAPEPLAAKRPSCPHCGRADDVVEIGDGLFQCDKPPHGVIRFTESGKIVPKPRSTVAATAIP